MREFLAVVSALSDPSRLRLLLSLCGRELCVCNLVEFIGLADSTVSKHMSILREAGLVESRKKGRWVYYRLADQDASPLARRILDLACDSLSQDRMVVADGERVIKMRSKEDGTRCQPDAVPCATEKLDLALATS